MRDQMSGNDNSVRRSSRLQNNRKSITKVTGRKRCRIADDSSSSSESTEDALNDYKASHNTSLDSVRHRSGSHGGNFTRIYSSYNKETNHVYDLNTYEEDFIDDGDESCSSDYSENGMVGEDDNGGCSEENNSQLNVSIRRRKRKRKYSLSESSSGSDIGRRIKKQAKAPVRSSSRAVLQREKKEADKMEKLQELERTRVRRKAGLPIDALKEDSEDDSDAGEDNAAIEEDDDKFVVSDSEVPDQLSDAEHSNEWHVILSPLMSTRLFTADHISEVKKRLFKFLKNVKSIGYDRLVKALEGANADEIEAIMKTATGLISCSTIAHLALQLIVCYGHFSLIELLLQYKADPNAPDRRGIIPLTLAAACGHFHCFKELLHHTKLLPLLAQHPTLLHVVVEAALSSEGNDNSYDMMQLLFDERREFFDQMMSSKTRPTVAEMTIWYGRVLCLSFLLEHCTEAFSDDCHTGKLAGGFPYSPILLAVCSPYQQQIGNDLILETLLDKHIGNINLMDNKNWTSLMWSMYYQNIHCMKLLIDHCATVYCPDEHGTSCLHLAALLGSTEGAQLLIDSDHPVDCADGKGWPPLLYANFFSERECVLAIMKAKPNQLFMLGKLLERSSDVDSEAKTKTYVQVQRVLEAIAQHEAYYAVFNRFICDNPDILTEEGGDSTFLQKCKDLLDFSNKKRWFDLMLDNLKKFATCSDYGIDPYGYTSLRDISRDSVMMTAYERLKYALPSKLRMNFSVMFYNEPGIAAGPRREFWSCFSKDIVKKEHHLFQKCYNSHYTFTPHDILVHEKCHRCVVGDRLNLLKFIGKMLAVAVCHKDVISFRLAQPVLKLLLGMPLTHPDDLETFDSEYYQNFCSYDGDISDLELSFSDCLFCPYCGKCETFNLHHNGSNHCEVTEDNKAEFIKAVSVFKLEYSVKNEIKSFLEGFWEAIPMKYLRIFTPDQFSLLLSGVPTIDVDDWERNTEYSHYASSIDNTAEITVWFWSLVRSLVEEEKALLLKFCTGSPRVPAGGFAYLEGLSGPTKFRISFTSGVDRIPEASTCFNNLKLCHYTSEQQCRDKILIAIRFGCEGFSFG